MGRQSCKILVYDYLSVKELAGPQNTEVAATVKTPALKFGIELPASIGLVN